MHLPRVRLPLLHLYIRNSRKSNNVSLRSVLLPTPIEHLRELTCTVAAPGLDSSAGSTQLKISRPWYSACTSSPKP